MAVKTPMLATTHMAVGEWAKIGAREQSVLMAPGVRGLDTGRDPSRDPSAASPTPRQSP
jgi:hypothetical protein